MSGVRYKDNFKLKIEYIILLKIFYIKSIIYRKLLLDRLSLNKN